MKKHQLDHILQAAGNITGQKVCPASRAKARRYSPFCSPDPCGGMPTAW